MTENNGNVEKSKLQTALEKEFGAGKVTDLADDLSSVKINNKTYSINGKTSSGGNQDDDDDVLVPGKKATTTVKDNYTDTSESKKKATIPAGFTVSNIDGEKNVDDGLVIYLIPDGENPDWTTKATGDNFAENTIYDIQTKYDQFVWVPVSNINNMVMCKNNNKDGHICNIQLNDEKTSLSCTASNQNSELCGKLYWDENNWAYQANKTNQTWTDDSGLREPDFVTDYDNNSSYNDGVISLNVDDGIKSEFLKMATSVVKYGGFWVGRYESSFVSNKTRQLAGQTSMNASQDTSKKWYGLYTRQKNFASDNSITSSVVSQMIWGSQYDAMMNWMAGDSTIDVTAYPPKTDVTYNTSRVTGATKNGSNTINDKLKNVYDLTGNSGEWTQEASHTNGRVYRGGSYNYSNSPSGRDYSRPGNTYDDNGSRLSLYIK
ncbi:MAG: hypothetical protein IJK18_03170 [Clostridia bacterium]|nr:hypothetical protein [Clostridia bacterium]